MIMLPKKPVRILQVVGGMNRGGIETWLMHVLRHIDRTRFQMDFLVHTTEPCPYDDEVRALGSMIIPCLTPSRPLMYARNLARILREHGPYDVVHSHVHSYSGYVLRLARQAGVGVRIAHSHNDMSMVPANPVRQAYLRLMDYWMTRHATEGLACSRKAASDLFGLNWHADRRWQLLYYGIDVQPFQTPCEREVVRAELNIPPDAFVIGHVGRFVKQKNHRFLIDIAAAVAQHVPNMRLLLIGDGMLRREIEQQVAERGLSDQVVFAGLRQDVPRLMRGAMDVFVLPSLHEGLPVVGLEVQSAGLPFFLTDVITEELDQVKSLIHRLSLKQHAATWAACILAHWKSPSPPGKPDTTAIVEHSQFNIHYSVERLAQLYAKAQEEAYAG